MYRSLIAGGVLAWLFAAAPAAQAQTVLTRIAPIETTEGALSGKVLASSVRAWLGVPFAKPPVDKLRWQPPQPIHWKGVWDADRKMPECIQVLRPHDINHYFGEEATSEDCLYMNIWAPAGSHAGSNLPVIVFIYGGGNTIGSSGMALYSGEPIAKTGKAIFVNFNYRVGILGFMAHPALSKEQGGHSGDYAYLDQNAALRWVHDNIAKFGGDPEHVLIMGQSAGAISVSLQMFSPLSKGLFSAALMSSGCSWQGGILGQPLPTLAEAEKVGVRIQERLGAKSITAMRDVPADKILALQAEHQVGANNAGFQVGPIVDDYFMPASRLSILRAHRMNDVPIVASFNHEDLDAYNPLVSAKTADAYDAIAKRMYGRNAAEFLKLFPVASASDIRKVAINAAREADLEQTARGCARFQHEYNKSPAYIDMFARNPSFAPGAKFVDLNPETAGAYHTADIPFWFGTLDVFNIYRRTRDWTAADRKMSAHMMGALIGFARTGSPKTPEVDWPAWTPRHERKVVFGRTIHVENLDTRRMDWLLRHPAKRLPRNSPERPRPHD